jgi:hypothetical protein
VVYTMVDLSVPGALLLWAGAPPSDGVAA